MKKYILFLCTLTMLHGTCAAKLNTRPAKGKLKEHAILKIVGGIGLIAGGLFLGGKGMIHCYLKKDKPKLDSFEYEEEPCDVTEKIEKYIKKTIKHGSIVLSVPCILTGILLAKKGIKDFCQIKQEEKLLVYPIELLV